MSRVFTSTGEQSFTSWLLYTVVDAPNNVNVWHILGSQLLKVAQPARNVLSRHLTVHIVGAHKHRQCLEFCKLALAVCVCVPSNKA